MPLQRYHLWKKSDEWRLVKVLKLLTANQQALDNAIDRWAELEERSQSAR